VKAEQGSSGVKAQTNLPTGSNDSLDGKKAAFSPDTTKQGNHETYTMYKCDNTYAGGAFFGSPPRSTMNRNMSSAGASVAKTVSGLSFAGKSTKDDGSVLPTGAVGADSVPVLSTTIEKLIGGSVVVSQLDPWMDSALNKRATVHVCVHSIVDMDEELQVRPSSRNPKVLVLSFNLVADFTNPDKKLSYLLERLAEAFPSLKDDPVGLLTALQSHPRYISCKKTLQALKGSKPHFSVEARITCPFEIDDTLVSVQEDRVFFGHRKIDKDSGTHLHFELKEKGTEFKRVSWEGAESFEFISPVRTARRSMAEVPSPYRMSSIPEEVKFTCSRRNMQTGDDDSTIPSVDEREVAASVARGRAAAAAVGGDDDSSMDITEVYADADPESSGDEEESHLVQMFAQAMAALNKKKKTKKGKRRGLDGNSVAAGTTNSSQVSLGSRATRGSAREQKRKSPKSNEQQQSGAAGADNTTVVSSSKSASSKKHK
jgi:hypothetical protein